MSFKLLIVNTFYQNYIHYYYKKYPDIADKTYKEQYKHILINTSEMLTAYTNSFNIIGIETKCIVMNALPLQKSWLTEKGLKFRNSKTAILEQVKAYQPDAIWLGNKGLVDTRFINQIRKEVSKVKLIFSYYCSQYNNLDTPNFKALDFMLTCTPGFKENYEKEGIRSYLSYHAFDSRILSQVKETKKSTDLLFTGSLFLGNGLHTERTMLIEEILKQNIEIKIYGNLESKSKIYAKKALYLVNKSMQLIKLGNLAQKLPYLNQFYDEHGLSYYSKELIKSMNAPVFGLDMLSIVRNSKITLNKHIAVAGEFAGNFRLFEATGMGSCLLTDKKKNLPELFEEGKEIVSYDSNEDCIEKIKWLQDHEKERKEIALAGQKRTLSSHTIEQRCSLIASIINKNLKNK